MHLIPIWTLLALAPSTVSAQALNPTDTVLKSSVVSGLGFRSIGPAVTSGRIIDIAIHPSDKSTWYVAAASGGVWKTVNAGTTWSPIFDGQNSYSIGAIAIDPKNPLVVWVGTGENNSQRSVSYGDGVYKSLDGGKTWENVGLKGSEHVGMIKVDPRNSDIVYVAAQGPLWKAGGDRGVYKSTDGGKTWKQVLAISDYTGANEVHFDPRNPDILYASSYQRARRVWTLIDGGPESAIYKSTDAGVTWKKVTNGLPTEEMGRIGLAVSPANPDILYAHIEAANKAGGVYRSTDGGTNWQKMNSYVSTSPQYYQRMTPDPIVADRVYFMDTFLSVTEDGGKTVHAVGEGSKHVDNHAMWIDQANTSHVLVGCDGGLYESFDRGATWSFVANLPLTQFYKIALDNDMPFYNVYGGTQDNNTLGGPSRTLTNHGIRNSDWYVTVGGDGFTPAVDPKDPNIVYSEWQHGQLVRFDRRTGETVDIQPQAEAGEALRWNWDSPLIISPHSNTRLYFGAQRLFRTDDRGNGWKAVSPDLTRQIDRNRLKVMDRVWSVDAVAKNTSTSFYGNIVSLSESPLREGVLYAGTDDGLIQVTEDGGTTWRKIATFPGVPELTYVSRVDASKHNAATVYATFDNHKMGDFAPYALKSTDAGRTWTSIVGDLPIRGSVYAFAEDHINPNLLFVGTEFGVFFTVDQGKHWVQLKAGLPTIAVRDIKIQVRENDLALGTFGRGIYILDDYSPLRTLSTASVGKEAELLPVRATPLFVPSSPMGGRDKASQGDAFYVAPNPPFGATFTYYLKADIKTRKQVRQDAEKEATKKKAEVFYPSWETLRAEDAEETPAIVLIVSDETGNVIRRIAGPTSTGMHRVTWDLRYPSAEPVSLAPPQDPRDVATGYLVVPGTYRVSLAKRVEGIQVLLGEPQTFQALPLHNASLPEPDRAALIAFERNTARLQRAVLGAVEAVREAETRISHIKKSLDETPGADTKLGDEARRIESTLRAIKTRLTGDAVIRARTEPSTPSIVERVQTIIGGHWYSTGDATQTHRRNYDLAAGEFGGILDQLRTLVESDLKKLQDAAEAIGAPWTPGRVPAWKPEK